MSKKLLVVHKENKILVGIFSSKKQLSKSLGIKKSKLADYCLHNQLVIHKVGIDHLSMINLPKTLYIGHFLAREELPHHKNHGFPESYYGKVEY